MKKTKAFIIIAFIIAIAMAFAGCTQEGKPAETVDAKTVDTGTADVTADTDKTAAAQTEDAGPQDPVIAKIIETVENFFNIPGAENRYYVNAGEFTETENGYEFPLRWVSNEQAASAADGNIDSVSTLIGTMKYDRNTGIITDERLNTIGTVTPSGDGQSAEIGLEEIKKIIEDHYNSLGAKGFYSISSFDTEVVENGYKFVLRYAMSEEEAAEVEARGGTVMPNMYVADLTVNTVTGDVNVSEGDDWNYLEAQN